MSLHSEKLAAEIREAAALDLQLDLQDEDTDLGLPLEEHKKHFEIATDHQRLKEDQDTHGLRVNFSWCIFSLVCVWLLSVAVCVFMSGLQAWGFHLPDAVLIAFITSTTVNVLGLFVVVAKWMYPNSSPEKAPRLEKPSRQKIESKHNEGGVSRGTWK